MKITKITLSSLALFAGLSLTSCNNGDTDTSQTVENGLQDAADRSSEVMDKAGDKMSNAADKTMKAMDEAGDKMSNAADKTMNAMSDAGDAMSNAAEKAEAKIRFGVQNMNYTLNNETQGLHDDMVKAAHDINIRMNVLQKEMMTATTAAKVEMKDQYNKLEDAGSRLQEDFDQFGEMSVSKDWKKFEKKTREDLAIVDDSLGNDKKK
jgi:ankyrin